LIRVLHIFGKMQRGGAEIRTVELMPFLAKKGIILDFCTLSGDLGPGQLDKTIHDLGGNVYTCPLKPGLWSFGRRFVDFLRQSEHKIVHSHVHYASGYIARLAYRAGVQGRIVHFRSIGDGKANTISRWLYHRIMRRMVNNYATAILAVCRGAMEYAWGENWQKDCRCRIIYNGIDLPVFKNTVANRKAIIDELQIPKDSKLIVNVGSFRPAKAHDVLLAAAAYVVNKNSNAHFILVGEGRLREQMQCRAAELGIVKNVHFLGSRKDVPRILKSADCFVLSSRREGLPGVVLEAVAAGLNVVATDLPGVREIAEHTDCIQIVPVENAKKLSEQLLGVIESGKVKDNAIESFPKEFDMENCAENVFEVYTEQLRSDRPCG